MTNGNIDKNTARDLNAEGVAIKITGICKEYDTEEWFTVSGKPISWAFDYTADYMEAAHYDVTYSRAS